MDTSTILTVIGTIATVVFGILGVYLVKRKYDFSRINLVIKNSIGVFDFIENWRELEVLVNKKPVPHNLVLLIGIWRNSGTVEITRTMTYEKLALKLPPGYSWLDAKVIPTNSKVNATLSVNPQSLEFDFNLFKSGEHIRFEALANVPLIQQHPSTQRVETAGNRLCNALTIEYRIEKTRDGVKEDVFSLGLASKSRMRKLALASTLVVAVCFGLSFMWFPAKDQGGTYLMKDTSGNEREVKLDFSAPGSDVIATYVATGTTERLPVSEVKRRRYSVAPDRVTWSSFIFPFVPMILALTAIFVTTFYIDKKKKRDFRSFLASCEPYPPGSQLVNEVSESSRDH